MCDFNVLDPSYLPQISTGKRRYGHPALTGVLPFPWLPIKKGQSLNRHRDTGDDGSPAVVLTLRKKYSAVRRPQSQQSNDSGASASSEPSGSGAAAGTSPTQLGERVEPSDRSVLDRNPWEEDHSTARSRPRPHSQRTAGQVYRRLSFDAASGVIALPEDGNWLGEDESDSDDYGEMQNSTMVDSQISVGEANAGAAQAGSPSKRYSTYYHHPERRKTYTQGAP